MFSLTPVTEAEIKRLFRKFKKLDVDKSGESDIRADDNEGHAIRTMKRRGGRDSIVAPNAPQSISSLMRCFLRYSLVCRYSVCSGVLGYSRIRT